MDSSFSSKEMIAGNFGESESQISLHDRKFVENQQGPKKSETGVIEKDEPESRGRISEVSTFSRMPNSSAAPCDVEGIPFYTIRTDRSLAGVEPLVHTKKSPGDQSSRSVPKIWASRMEHGLGQPDEILGSRSSNPTIPQHGVEIQKYFIRTEKVRDRDPALRSSYWEVLCQYCGKSMQSNAKTMENHFCGKRSKICPIAPASICRDAKRIHQERCEQNKVRKANSSRTKSGQEVSDIVNMKRSYATLQELSSKQRSIDKNTEALRREVGDMHRKVSSGSSASIENFCQLQRKGSSTLSQYKMKLFEAFKEELRKSKEELRKELQQQVLDEVARIRSEFANGTNASSCPDASVAFPVLENFNVEREENAQASDRTIWRTPQAFRARVRSADWSEFTFVDM